MVRATAAKRSSLTGLVFVFCSCLAGLYVAGRLWTTTRQLYYLVSPPYSYALSFSCHCRPACTAQLRLPGLPMCMVHTHAVMLFRQEQELAIFQQNRLQLSTQLTNRSGPELAAATGCASSLVSISQTVATLRPSVVRQCCLTSAPHASRPMQASTLTHTLRHCQAAQTCRIPCPENALFAFATFPVNTEPASQSGDHGYRRAGTNSSAATLFFSIRASAGVSGPLQARDPGLRNLCNVTMPSSTDAPSARQRCSDRVSERVQADPKIIEPA